MENLTKIHILFLFIQVTVYTRTYAGTIYMIQKRSVEGLEELDHTRSAVSDASSSEENAVLPPQINSFQFFLPFWWNYLRPMLSVFRTNANLRQTLQKEYEYEAEPRYFDEIDLFTTRTEQGPSSKQTEGNEAETSESNLNIESDIFIPFGLVSETNEQTTNEVPDIEASAKIIHFQQQRDDSKESKHSGENHDMEHSREEQRQFALTGNIVGSLTQSLMELLPSLQIRGENERHSSVETNDELDINSAVSWEQNESGLLKMKEANPSFEGGSFTIASTLNTYPMQNSIEHQTRQEDDIGDNGDRNIGSQINGFVSEHHESELSGLFAGEKIAPVDFDNSVSIADSDSGQTFTQHFFSANSHLQNDYDSNT